MPLLTQCTPITFTAPSHWLETSTAGPAPKAAFDSVTALHVGPWKAGVEINRWVARGCGLLRATWSLPINGKDDDIQLRPRHRRYLFLSDNPTTKLFRNFYTRRIAAINGI